MKARPNESGKETAKETDRRDREIKKEPDGYGDSQDAQSQGKARVSEQRDEPAITSPLGTRLLDHAEQSEAKHVPHLTVLSQP